MTLTYRKKLTIFHDTFLKYSLEEIDRQRKIGDGIGVPAIPTALEESLHYPGNIPVIREFVGIAVLIDNLRVTYGESRDATKIINNFFPPNQNPQIKLMLSEAIRGIAVELESSLIKSTTPQDVSKLAAISTLKLFTILKSGALEVEQLNAQKLIEAVTDQGGWLDSIFSSRAQVVSENYKFISELDLRSYLNTKDDGTSLSVYIRDKFELDEHMQIILQGEISADIESSGLDLSYKGLNGYEFVSEIFQVEAVKEELLNQKSITVKQGELLATHNKVIQRVEQKWEEELESTQQQNSVSFYNVRDTVHNFVGRGEILMQIHDCLTTGKSLIEIIGGLGGMGKTQAALQYIKIHKYEYGYRVRWIDAENKASLDASFRAFAQKLKLHIDKKTDDEIVQLVKEKLEEDVEQTLLVFDNVEDRGLVNQYLPNLGGAKQHHVLITTRNTKEYDKHATRRGEDVIQLTPFAKTEAIQYVKTILPESTDEEALALASLFDSIPLGLSQSVAYIENNAYTIKQYIDEYHRVREQGLPESLHDAEFEEEAGHVANIYTTLKISLNAISSIPKAVEILRICSYLHADAIPEYLFDSLFDNEKEKKDAIAILKGYSLISVRLEGDIRFIYIHRIVQAVTRFDIGDELLQYLKQAIDLVIGKILYLVELDTAIRRVDVIQENTPLLHHSISLIKFYYNVINKSKTTDIENLLGLNIAKLHAGNGNLYLTIPQYNNARKEFDKALEIQTKIQVEEGVLLYRTYHKIGDTYQALGMNQEALSFLEKSLEIGRSLYKENCYELADSIHSIGNVYQAIGLYQKAIDHYEESLQIKILMHDNNHPSVALTIHAIGQSHRSLENYEVALRKYQEALSMIGMESKKDEALVSVIIHAIANIFLSLEKPYEALTKYEESLRMKKKIYGNDHFSVAVTINGIGNVYKNLGRYKEALVKYEESLKMKIKAYGHDHPRVALTINAMGSIYQAIGMPHEALKRYEESLQIVRISYKDLLHPEIARDLQAIGDVYLMLGRRREALGKYQEVSQMQKEMYGDQHKNIDITFQKINIVNKKIFKEELNHHLFIASFAFKEAIESAPTLKYFLSEILHLPLPELPENLNNNYVWIGMHYTMCNIGIFAALGMIEPTSSLIISSHYANRVLTYEYLNDLRQEKFQNTEDKIIKTPIEFIEKCGPDILSQVSLVVMNNRISFTPTIYDIVISITVGVMQCYQQYNQVDYPIREQSIIQTIIPYVADTTVGISTGFILLQNCPLDFNTIFGKMMAIKQGFVVMSSVVVTDYIAKLILTTCEDFYFKDITKLAGETYKYPTAEEGNLEL